MLLCNFWQFWIQFAFGALLWLGCIILRMYRLYAILIVTNMRMNIKNPRLWMYARLAALCAPYFIFATIATALNATPVVSQPTSAGVNVEMCLMDSWALYMLVALCFVYLVPPVVLMYKLRNIRKFLNEFRETKFAFWCIVTGTIVYGFVTVMSWHNKVWGRVLCVAIILVMLNLSYWLIIGPTIVGRYFDPDATLAKFNAEKDYHPSSSSSKQNSASGKKHHSSSKKPISHRSDSSSRQPSEGITSGTDGTEFEVRLSQHEFSVVLPQEGTFEESNEEA
ncbi:hypothetical protein, variant [Capsaspora owczarzaki ATCC 30864]|nr:hypothetical protein, variant [Capsaspora owczarzaki ATCC 30864]KJE90372.1 hypothetical protein, variant 1 [Capsaspora owczarzaki ATCC 30864]KJE90373.1 hypothetical protein, variant 2 [Capsaspora owczarzaki ATCC 30864]KJE90374.1 hypothetical protein, variant 3 [Capsaspora owczarzaki ATCC 30864]KJE90375.1 hypothetical protein, variant 4 [Capsaspora owczarzaki ATCC 30864]KJE90376.1 hypothetical protein, variant 5 [Capsaspora owczarzaki ATCC 30864]|eukprot:XP_011270122.1 hypothetical protein, variant [Capsaspora owczarzaki ATCC 30864]